MSSFLDIFDGCDIEGVSALIDRLEKSSFDYLRLEGDGMCVVIGKNGAGEAFGEVSGAVAASAVPVYSSDASAAPASAASSEADGKATEQDEVSVAMAPATTAMVGETDIPEQEGVVIVRAPSQGLFFAQPEPGTPPYVTVGTTVKTGDTLALIEIMKTYSALTSPVDGDVIAIHVVNEQYLEPDQALISIKI